MSASRLLQGSVLWEVEHPDDQWRTFAYEAQRVATEYARHNAAEVVALTSIEMRQLDPPTDYRYRIRTADDRTWTQIVTFGVIPDTDPPMTFTVPDGWRQSEFSHGRSLRQHVINMVNAGLTHLTIEWS